MRIYKIISLIIIPFFGFSETEIHEIKTKSAVNNVIVYHTGAEVTRSFDCDLKKGLNKVSIPNLSALVIKDHIRIVSNNQSDVMNIEYTYLKDIQEKIQKKKIPFKDSSNIEMMRDTIKDFQILEKEQISILSDYQYEKKFLEEDQLRVKSRKEGEGLTLVDFKEMISFYRIRANEITSAMIKINKKLNLYRYEFQRINTQISKLQQQHAKRLKELNPEKEIEGSWNIILTIKSPKARKENFELKYIVGSVGWGPKYNMSISEVDNEIELEYFAYVVNQCGEDWMDVPIKLVSAMPLESQAEPILEPWIIDRYERAISNSASYVDASKVQFQYGDVKVLQGIKYREIEIAALGIEFNLSKNYSLLSDSKPYKIKVKEHKVPAAFTYYAVPKVDPNAYLIASIGGWEKLELIAGNVDIFNNDVYMGTSFMEPGLEEDTLSFSLGKNNKLIVMREPLQGKMERKETNGKIKESFVYGMKIKNSNSIPVNVIIKDQSPLAQDEEIEIRNLNLSGAKFDKATGEVMWAMEMKPNASKDLEFAYMIKFPKEKENNASFKVSISKQKKRGYRRIKATRSVPSF
jgi:uncharacterized protein (TIGR02231 family)